MRRGLVFAIVGFLCLSCGSSLLAQKENDDERVRWLREHAKPIRSIDPADDNFADLMPLVERIGQSRIVMLGEQTHGDGATFVAKSRLVRFLHQVMGFDVLAWESGLFDCLQVDSALHSTQPLEDAIAKGIFGIWGRTQQVRPVFEYVRSTYSSAHPLEVAGFDAQFSASSSPDVYRKALLNFFDNADPQVLSIGQRTNLEAALGRLKDLGKLTPEERKEFLAAVHGTLSSISTSHECLRRSHSTREIAFQVQMLKNLPVLLEKETLLSANKGNLGSVLDNNGRDRQMAENLIWLAKERYPDRKIIVWAASFHIMRKSPSIDTSESKLPPGREPTYKGLVTMGDTVCERLGDEVYTVGFTAYQGKFGSAERPREVATAPDGSLDALLHQVGAPYLFLDFRSLRRQPEHWLRQSIVARPLGYMAMRANWTEIFDAMIFTDTMFPVSVFNKPSEIKP